jgi:hypothetical protein
MAQSTIAAEDPRMDDDERPTFRFGLRALFLLTAAATPFFVWMAYQPDEAIFIAILMVGVALTVAGFVLRRVLIGTLGMVLILALVLIGPAFRPVRGAGRGSRQLTLTLLLSDAQSGAPVSAASTVITDSFRTPFVTTSDDDGIVESVIQLNSHISTMKGQRQEWLYLDRWKLEISCPGFDSRSIPLADLLNSDFSKTGPSPAPIKIALTRTEGVEQ